METIGKYQIEKKIGGGGFGEVFKAYDPFIKRHVAIKTCSADDQEIADRFYQEAEIGGNLHHRNVTTVYDFGIHEGLPYLVQEYLSGEDLDVKVKRRDYLPYTEKLFYLLQIARGLAYAHSKGYIHRDVKPANIRILEDGTAKIMDFGIARLAQQESGLTETGMTVGTAAYLSPEQVRGDKLDLRTDIFSFGILAYELLTYERPFQGEQISTVIYNLLHKEPEPIASHWPGAPPELVAVIDRCLRKDASQRYADGGELVRDLEALKRRGRGTQQVEAPVTQRVAVPDPVPAASSEPTADRQTATVARGASGLEYDLPGDPVPATGPSVAMAARTSRSSVVSLVVLLLLAVAAGAGGWWLGTRDAPESDGTPPDSSTTSQPTTDQPSVDADAGDGEADAPPIATAGDALPATGAPGSTVEPAATGEEPPPPPPPAPTTGKLVLPRVPWTDRVTARVGSRSYGLHRRHTLELPPGRYRVAFELAAGSTPESYRPGNRSAEFQVVAGETARAEVPIPQPGAFSVRPLLGRAQGQVSIDGELLGSTPLVRFQREPGTYNLEILPRASEATSSENGGGLRQEIRLESGQETILTFDLDAGTLRTTTKTLSP